MSRNDGLKAVNYRLDPQILKKLDKLCNQFAIENRAWVIELGIARLAELSKSDFQRLFDTYYQHRSFRKRELKLQVSKEKTKE